LATRHDVVSHLRHFAEQAGEAGSILHLGATSAFITDNTDVLVIRRALEILRGRLATVVKGLAGFAKEHRGLATLAYTHLQPAQLTTMGKRACLWAQDFLTDLETVQAILDGLRCRGVKGTTGTQASYLTLFEGDHNKVRRLDEILSRKLGFSASYPVTGQTYPRKQDTRVMQVLAGIGESCHKVGTDWRLLQGLGELSEPFGPSQVGSSAMAYKRNPIRAERMCSLSRRLITDSLNGSMTMATQWLERSLDDSANRRLVIPDMFMTADAVLMLAGSIAAGLTVRPHAIRYRVERELPFMATESLLMKATVAGGDRQELHEILRRYSMEAHETVSKGEANPLIDRILGDPAFGLSSVDTDECLDPTGFVGRSAEQVDDFLDEVVGPSLSGLDFAPAVEPRV
jgi:adenylosuccinate lyase